jgi:hypothetical protein
MSAALVALVVGTLLAVGALAFVLYPLFFGVQSVPVAEREIAHNDAASLEQDVAVAALREIEFDRATGKLSDTDYVQLKERYMGDALAVLRRSTAAPSGAPPASVDDEIERAVRTYRLHHPDCLTCGPRPEPDAIYCSTCGRYLRGSCVHCGSRIDEVGARFCRSCGQELAVNAA